MRSAFLAISLIASGVVSTVNASAAQITHYNVSNWFVGVYSNDQTNQFANCTASVTYKSNISMTLTVDRDYKWSIGFYNPAWQLAMDNSYNVAMSIDGAAPITEIAKPYSKQLAAIALPDNVALFNKFRKGNLLTVSTAGGNFQFDLTGTSAVLTNLLQCVRSRVTPPTSVLAPVTATTNGNPFAPITSPVAASPTSTVPNQDQIRAEATTLAANILSASGITGFRIMPPSEIPSTLKVDAAWRVGDVIGAVNVVPNSLGWKLSDFPASVIGDDAKSCKGKFASGSLPEGNNQMTRVFTSCENDQSTFTLYYIFANRPGGGFYRFMTMETGQNNASAAQEDTSLRQAVVKTLYEH